MQFHAEINLSFDDIHAEWAKRTLKKALVGFDIEGITLFSQSGASNGGLNLEGHFTEEDIKEWPNF